MTDNGDDGGFQPHPGDPWHPGWTDDDNDTPTDDPTEGAKKKRRGLFRRREKDDPSDVEPVGDDETAVEPSDEAVEDLAISELPPTDDDADTAVVDGVPAAEAQPDDGEDVADDGATASEPVASESDTAEPLPAWMTDEGVDEDATLPVEMPSWVGTDTVGADDTSAGFEETGTTGEDDVPEEGVTPDRADTEDEYSEAPVVEPIVPPARATEHPTPAEEDQKEIPEDDVTDEDLAAALSALGALEDGDEIEEPTAEVPPVGAGEYGVATSEAFDALRRLEDEEPAPPGDYGVAGKEAFDALREEEADDLDEWAAFAGSGPAPDVPGVAAEPLPETVEPAAGDLAPPPDSREVADDVVEELLEPVEEKPRRGIWPFRRRDRGEDMAAEEATEWRDDGQPVPASWFPDVDEDEVRPPEAALPETEWPEPATDPDAEFRPPAGPDPVTAPTEVVEPLASGSASERPTDETQPVDEFGELAEPPVAPEPVSPEQFTPTAPPEDPAPAAPLRDEEPWRLQFDDGTDEQPYVTEHYDPRPAAPVPGDREDEWVTGPVDLDPDATVEMSQVEEDLNDGIYASAGTMEHRGLAEEINRTSQTDTEWQAMSAAMPGVQTGVVGFEDVADLRTGEEYRERVDRSDLGARVITGVGLAVFLLGSLFVGGAVMAAFIGAIALLALFEFYTTLRRVEFRPLAVFGYLGGAGMLAAAWFHGPVAIPVAVVLTVVVVFFVYAFSPLRQDALANGSLTVMGAAWVAGTMAFAIPILRHPDFEALVLAVVVATVGMDVGAYAFGRAWGKRALAPVLSPNKSVEGLIGGVLMAVGGATAFGAFVEPFDVMSGLAVGTMVAVVAPLGDLAESMVKRSLGVKDMGSILPGHGGMLDRIDAFLFVLPAAWALYMVIGFFG